MKCFSLVVLAASLAAANAAECDLTKVAPLLTDPSVATCTADSGFSFTALVAPTAATATKLCSSAACKKVLAAVTGLGLGDCTLLGLKLESELITPVQTACAGSTSSASNSTTSASNSTSSAAKSTSAAKSGSSAGSKASSATVGSTTAPKASTINSGSGASASTVSTPSAAKTPAPTTAKSGASSVALASGAVAVAIAAAFF